MNNCMQRHATGAVVEVYVYITYSQGPEGMGMWVLLEHRVDNKLVNIG